MAGIYIHVPFCRQACHYCDFHFSTQTSTAERMVHSIVREAQIRRSLTPDETRQNVSTLYLGGGTPSLLSPAHISALVSGVSEAFGVDVHRLSEVTLEANPEDLTPERLSTWKAVGISRLSVGIQSFHDPTLGWMNRAHSGREAKEGVLLAAQAGFENISIDLIYGVPTSRSWREDLQCALELPVNHVSAYALTVEPQTVLGTRISRGSEPELSDARAVEEYNQLCLRMQQEGWLHYETSNWAAPLQGAQGHALAKHNSSYWSGSEYVGLGPGAHGFLGSTRYANVSNNPAYLKSLDAGVLDQECETLTNVDRYNEGVMTGLRTSGGISPAELSRRTGLRPEQVDENAWVRALEQGDLVALPNGFFRVPEERWITGDRVAASLFEVAST